MPSSVRNAFERSATSRTCRTRRRRAESPQEHRYTLRVGVRQGFNRGVEMTIARQVELAPTVMSPHGWRCGRHPRGRHGAGRPAMSRKRRGEPLSAGYGLGRVERGPRAWAWVGAAWIRRCGRGRRRADTASTIGQSAWRPRRDVCLGAPSGAGHEMQGSQPPAANRPRISSLSTESPWRCQREESIAAQCFNRWKLVMTKPTIGWNVEERRPHFFIGSISTPTASRYAQIGVQRVGYRRCRPPESAKPTEWASVASIGTAPADTSDGSGGVAWAATPVNARYHRPPATARRGCPGPGIRSPRRTEPSAVGKRPLVETRTPRLRVRRNG